MKVRWNRDSFRLRITPTELQALVNGEAVREELPLPDGGCWAAQIVSASGGETRLASDSQALTVALSRADVARLAVPEAEGVYFQHEGAFPLRYLIEKDFPCVHPRAIHAQEPPTETFAPPNGFEERKRDL